MATTPDDDVRPSSMHHPLSPAATRRTVALAAAVLALTACTATDDASPSASPTTSSSRVSASPSASGSADVTPDPVTTSPPTDTATSPAPPPAPTSGSDGTPALAQVEVTITFAGWNPGTGEVEVGGYAGVVESGGTCTLSLTGDGRTVEGTSPALPDAASTSCGGVTVPGSGLGSGTWTARLTYVSPTSTGTSAATEVVIP